MCINHVSESTMKRVPVVTLSPFSYFHISIIVACLFFRLKFFHLFQTSSKILRQGWAGEQCEHLSTCHIHSLTNFFQKNLSFLLRKQNILITFFWIAVRKYLYLMVCFSIFKTTIITPHCDSKKEKPFGHPTINEWQ